MTTTSRRANPSVETTRSKGKDDQSTSRHAQHQWPLQRTDSNSGARLLDG